MLGVVKMVGICGIVYCREGNCEVGDFRCCVRYIVDVFCRRLEYLYIEFVMFSIE